MDLFDVIRSCARRWYVLIPLLLVVGWFSYDVYSSVKPVYYSSAVIGLAPRVSGWKTLLLEFPWRATGSSTSAERR